MPTNQPPKETIKILSLVEATNVNAVAKNVLEFYRSAQELSNSRLNLPCVEACIATFSRQPDEAQSANEFVMSARQLGVNVEIIPERRRFDFSVLPALRSVMQRNCPDVVVTHSIKSHFLVWRSRVWQQYPWVAFHHGYTTTDLKMRAYNHLDRWSLPSADRVVTVCHAFARELARNTGLPVDNISVQHNSIRPAPSISAAEAQSVRSKLGIVADELVVLAVGRLSREKAHSDLLAAFKYFPKNDLGNLCKLIIVGEGPERERLEATAEALGCKERVIFAGQIADVQPFYAAADVLVIPSHSEGSSNVLLEAMAAHLPVVATAVGGVPEMVADNESALLVPPGDPQVMGAAIKRLLGDQQLARRLAANASQLAAERYSPLAYACTLTKIYSEVSRQRASDSASGPK